MNELYQQVAHIGQQQRIISIILDGALYIVIPCVVGAYGSDYVKAIKKQGSKVSLSRIFISMTVSIIVSYSIFYTWLADMEKLYFLPVISLLIGSLGFDIIMAMSSVDNAIVFVGKLSKLLVPIILIASNIVKLITGNFPKDIIAPPDKGDDNNGRSEDTDTDG